MLLSGTDNHIAGLGQMFVARLFMITDLEGPSFLVP